MARVRATLGIAQQRHCIAYLSIAKAGRGFAPRRRAMALHRDAAQSFAKARRSPAKSCNAKPDIAKAGRRFAPRRRARRSKGIAGRDEEMHR